MRILRVAQEMYPEVLGGGAYHTHALSRDQAALGHDVTVLTVSTPERVAETPIERRDGYTLVRRTPSLSLMGNDFSLGMADYLRRYGDDFDVVHAHSHVYLGTSLAALVGRLTDVPLAMTCHGLFSVAIPHWLSRAHLRTLGRWTYNGADVVFTYTAAERRQLRSFGVAADVSVVSNGIDADRFTPEGQTVPELDVDGTALLYVGRLAQGKRPRDALETLARLVPERDVHLFYCGDGPQREALERRARDLGVADAVHFLGRIPYDDMPAVYRSADVFFLPSGAEGFPRTVMEALASGVPAVTSRLEQLVDVVSSAGAVADIGDVAGYAAAIADLVDDPARRARLGRVGRETVEERFNWTDTVRETTARVETLVGEP